MGQPSTLVIGSTGKTGRRIVHRLEERGHSVRGVSRHSDPPFDWQEPSTWPRALHGVESAYVSFFPDLAVPGAPAAIEELTSCAVDAGVRRLVLLSGRGEANAQRCEEIVRGSGLSHTLIRASWFSQNFTEGHLFESVLDGVIALPAGDVGEPFVDADDIADVAVAALTDDRHSGRLYELTGPRLLTFHEAAAEISKALGREVEYVSVSSEQFRAALTRSVGPEAADLLTALCDEVLDGRNASLGHGVREALGREPRDFTDFCRAAAASGAWER
ncbi:NmrA family NAD(P)-binding protein [Streptosporangium carneum]|uniref:NmrA family transcriptional regulator n=1 Tax=Streptosporangium carneum TaxID=47481 RepID=A0A9W6HXJ7_9ACTN|nr:NmrA family NAD(P)-binding protein [Streptosporangium carneum]GLK07596.1 NmrA family transcriptional regulator [Streptosporangium carneum]